MVVECKAEVISCIESKFPVRSIVVLCCRTVVHEECVVLIELLDLKDIILVGSLGIVEVVHFILHNILPVTYPVGFAHMLESGKCELHVSTFIEFHFINKSSDEVCLLRQTFVNGSLAVDLMVHIHLSTYLPEHEA